MMNDCVFTAFRDHAKYLGVKVGLRERLYFYLYRRNYYGTFPWEPTSIDCAAYVLYALAHYSMGKVQVRTRCEVYEPAEVFFLARKGIDIEPAIYCSLNTKHAYFSETLPKDDWICLAIQITKSNSCANLLRGIR